MKIFLVIVCTIWLSLEVDSNAIECPNNQCNYILQDERIPLKNYNNACRLGHVFLILSEMMNPYNGMCPACKPYITMNSQYPTIGSGGPTVPPYNPPSGMNQINSPPTTKPPLPNTSPAPCIQNVSTIPPVTDGPSTTFSNVSSTITTSSSPVPTTIVTSSSTTKAPVVQTTIVTSSSTAKAPVALPKILKSFSTAPASLAKPPIYLNGNPNIPYQPMVVGELMYPYILFYSPNPNGNGGMVPSNPGIPSNPGMPVYQNYQGNSGSSSNVLSNIANGVGINVLSPGSQTGTQSGNGQNSAGGSSNVLSNIANNLNVDVLSPGSSSSDSSTQNSSGGSSSVLSNIANNLDVNVLSPGSSNSKDSENTNSQSSSGSNNVLSNVLNNANVNVLSTNSNGSENSDSNDKSQGDSNVLSNILNEAQVNVLSK